jgi:hypothetical protein
MAQDREDKGNRRERRRHERCSVRLSARIEISLVDQYDGKVMMGRESIVSLAETSNISIGGMSLHIVGASMDSRKSLNRSNAPGFVGRHIEVGLPDEGLTVSGSVLRADASSQELIVVVNKVSDVGRWKRLCSEFAEGVSIFPDTPQVRRKRRS